MGQENVELIKHAFEVMNAGDIEGGKKICDPEIELKTRFTGVAGRPYRGHRGVEGWFTDLADAWEDVEQTIERFIEVDEERTIAVGYFRGRGKGSGVEIQQQQFTIWTIRNGKLVAVETHLSLEDALAAAGAQE